MTEILLLSLKDQTVVGLLSVNSLIDTNLHSFCHDYVTNNSYNRSYAEDTLYEYYPDPELFKTNFNFASVAIGVLPTGNLKLHTDDGRSSVYIVPLTDITIIKDNNDILCSTPFILDTTMLHGASSMPNTMFIGFDFHMSYNELETYIKKFDQIKINVR